MNNTDREYDYPEEWNDQQRKAYRAYRKAKENGATERNALNLAFKIANEEPTPPTESVEGQNKSGIPEYDELVMGYQAGDITFNTLCSRLWNTGIKYGKKEAPHPTPESEGVEVEEVRLRLAEVVRYIDLMHWEIEGDLGALPLVDLLTPDEDESIKRGEDEILNIVDEIVPVVLDMLHQARQEERERMTEIAKEVKERHTGLHNANIALNEFLAQLQGGSDE